MIVLGFCFLIILSLIFSACFSGFESGIISVRSARLNHAIEQNSKRAVIMKRYLDRPETMLSAILLGNNISNCFLAVFFDELIDIYYNSFAISALGSIILTIIVLIFGEISPKVWFRQKPFYRCQLFIYPFYFFHRMFSPFIAMLTHIVKLLNKYFIRNDINIRAEASLMREDFRTMIMESHEGKLIDNEAYLLIQNGLEFHHTKVEDLSVKFQNVKVISSNATLKQALEFAQKHQVSRLPVSSEDGGKWIGIFSIYDAFFLVEKNLWGKKHVLEYIRPIVTISDQVLVHNVIPRSRISKSPFLVVLDKKNRQSGIITISDVLRPFIGKITL